jgi:hypothetical protein
MSKFTTQERLNNEKQNWAARERALEIAKARLREEGIEYPEYDYKKTPDENYEALNRYREKESNYMLQALKLPSGPRPIEVFGNKWEPYK